MSNVPIPRPGPLGLIQYAGVDMLQYAGEISAAKDAEIAQLRAELIKSLADNAALRADAIDRQNNVVAPLRERVRELTTQAMFNVSTIERLRAEVAGLRDFVEHAGRTGAEAMSTHLDLDDVCAGHPLAQRELAALRAEVAVLKAENAHARDCLNSATTLLTGIHSLMYPPEITTADGRVMVFRPKSIDPHEILQGLSDRIRALPDELAALAARKGEA